MRPLNEPLAPRAHVSSARSAGAPGPWSEPARAALPGETGILELMARGVPLGDIHGALCQAIGELFPNCACGIYLVDQTGPKLRLSAGAGVTPALNECICGPVLISGSGPCARAVRSGREESAGFATIQLQEQRGFTLSPAREREGWCWASPVTSGGGQVSGVVAIFNSGPIELTPAEHALVDRVVRLAAISIERAQRDSALRRSETFLAEAQRLSSTGSFSWNVATSELTWSDELYRIFGVARDVPVTFGLLRSRVHPEDWPSLERLLGQACEGIEVIEHEHRLLMPDRSLRHLRLMARGTFNEHGHLEYIGAIQDVTTRRLAEEALERSRTELWHMARVVTLGALSASIAHEVNQPLSGIITNATAGLRMLGEQPPDVKGALETLRRTLRDGTRAASVIARLRGLFGKRETSNEAVDLNEAAREVLALCQGELQKDGVQLRVDLTDTLPAIRGDRVQLQQVILNLLLNASEAMSGVEDRPRRLTIRTALDEAQRVCLKVSDTGVGLAPQDISQLSQPFYTTKSGGMGIGLFVSRSIVESHSGCLCYTPNEDHGATFGFAIPQAPPTEVRTELTRCLPGVRLRAAVVASAL